MAQPPEVERAAADDPQLRQFGYQQELSRSLSFSDLLIYGLIFMVPIAPFGIFGSVFQASGGMIALAYAIGGVAMAFTAVSYSQMARAFPMANGSPLTARVCVSPTRPARCSPMICRGTRSMSPPSRGRRCWAGRAHTAC